MIGITGAHRTGKTTLAQAFADSYNYTFRKTETGVFLHALGVDPKKTYGIEYRLTIQEQLLQFLKESWIKSSGSSVIVDRTPLDLLAYMEADILRDFPNSGELADRYMQYRADCLDCLPLFEFFVLVQPGIPASDEATSAAYSRPYMEHLNSLFLGYMCHLNSTYPNAVIPRPTLDLTERVEFIASSMQLNSGVVN